MCLQAGIKVYRKTGIESFLIDRGLKDVNVIKLQFVRLRRILRFLENSEANWWPAGT